MRSFVVAFALLIPACGAAARGSFQRTVPVAGRMDLQIQTGSGDVTIRTGPAGAVTVLGRIEASFAFFGPSGQERVRSVESRPPMRQAGDQIVLGPSSERNVSIDYDITVPPDTRVRAETGSGDHTVRGLRGDVDLTTGSGDIHLEDIVGNVRLETGSGSISGRGVAGSFDAHTGSGNIRVNLTAPGQVRARTGSGDAEIRGVSGGLAVDTGSGDVVVEGLPSSAWEVETSSGNVSVRVPSASSFDLDVSTGSGDITVGRPLQMTVRGRVGGDRDHVAGQVGRGGPLIKVRTGSGDVVVD